MSDVLKQRLVGAIVLVSLSVILWPIFMGTEQSRRVVLESNITQPPLFERFVIEDAESSADIKPVGSYQEKLQATKTELNDNNVLDADGLPTSWVIQLGSFADKNNVERLVSGLRADKRKVFVTDINKDGKDLIKIVVGPFIELKQAQRLQASIDKKYQLNSSIEKFIP